MKPQERDELVQLTQQYVGEWGLNHARRLLSLIDIIGEGLEYDREIVWVAAHLHDWGAYSPWAQPGVDHAQRSSEVARDYLLERNVPPESIETIVTCIRTHHQGDPNRPLEALLLSDADALDFLGVVGVLRVLWMRRSMGLAAFGQALGWWSLRTFSTSRWAPSSSPWPSSTSASSSNSRAASFWRRSSAGGGSSAGALVVAAMRR